MTNRVVERRTEIDVDVEYDSEGNSFDVETEVETISVLEEGVLVWEGTLGIANSLCPQITNGARLPCQRAPNASMRTDALWSLVAPYADEIRGEPRLHSTRLAQPVYDLGGGCCMPVETMPGRQSNNLEVRGIGVMPDDHEWLLVTGEDVRCLAHEVWGTCSQDEGVTNFAVGGIYVSEDI